MISLTDPAVLKLLQWGQSKRNGLYDHFCLKKINGIRDAPASLIPFNRQEQPQNNKAISG
jgi:hypothetical protein